MHTAQEKVRKWHEQYDMPLPKNPDITTCPGKNRIRAQQMKEHIQDFLLSLRTNDMVLATESLTQLLFILYSAAVATGIDLEPFFFEFHKTNMIERRLDEEEDFTQFVIAELHRQGWKPELSGDGNHA